MTASAVPAQGSPRADLRDLRDLWRIRLLEERVRDLRLAGDIVGSVHLCIGQEAGPVGVCSVLEPQDALFATYRGHGWALARGVPAAPLLAELLGGTPFLGFIAAVAFATILAVVAGLTLSGAAALSHDLWVSVVKKGNSNATEQLRVADRGAMGSTRQRQRPSLVPRP